VKRAWKWGQRILIASAIVVGLALVAWVTVVPGLVRRIATAELRRMGLRNVALQIRGVSLRHVQMANVAAGESERLRVGAVGVGFTIGGLLAGRLRVIELTGLETEIRFRDGKLDLGPLAELGAGGEGENPFTQVQLRSSAILLDLEGQRLRIPIEGTVADAGKGRLELDLRASAEGADLRVRGTLNANTSDFSLTLDGEVREVASWRAALPPRWAHAAPHVSGPVDFKASCYGGRDTWVLKAEADAYALKVAAAFSGHRFSAEQLDLSGKVTLRNGQLEGFTGNASAFGLDIDGLRLTRAGVYGGMLGKEAGFEAQLRGDGWSLDAMMGGVTGLSEALDGTPAEVAIESAWWTCSLDPQRLVAIVPALRDSLQIASPKPASIEGEKAVLRLIPPGTGSKTTWTWALDVPKAEAAWRVAELRLPASAIEFRGVEAKLPATFQVTPEQATLRLAAGARLTASEAKLPWLELRRTTQEPLLTLELGGKGLEANVPFGGEEPKWSLDIPELVVKLAEADLVLPDGLGKVEGYRGEFAFSIGADPKQAWLVLPRPFVASCRSAQANLGSEALRLGPLDLRCKPRELARGGGVELDRMAPVWGQADLNIQVSGPASASFGQGDSVTIPGGDIWVAAHWSRADGGFLYASLFSPGCEAGFERKLGDHVFKAHWPEVDTMAYVLVPLPAQRKAREAILGGFLHTPRGGSPATFSIAGADAMVGEADVKGKVILGGGAPEVEAKVSLDKVAVTHKASGLRVAG